MALSEFRPDLPLPRPLRSDAERNRLRILRAAEEVFAERGLDVSLDDIAAAAGVGVGTVYRRFPDKDDLIDALFEDKIGQVEQVARDALALEDPWDGFEAFMRGGCRLQARGPRPEGGDARARPRARARGPWRASASRRSPCRSCSARRTQASCGPTSATFDMPTDALRGRLRRRAHARAAPDYWERLLTVLLDGLKADAAVTPMPVEPLRAGRVRGRYDAVTGSRALTARYSPMSLAEANSGGASARSGTPAWKARNASRSPSIAPDPAVATCRKLTPSSSAEGRVVDPGGAGPVELLEDGAHERLVLVPRSGWTR